MCKEPLRFNNETITQPHKGWNRRTDSSPGPPPALLLLAPSEDAHRKPAQQEPKGGRPRSSRAWIPRGLRDASSRHLDPRHSGHARPAAAGAAVGVLAQRGSGSSVSAFSSRATQSAQGYEPVASPVSSSVCEPSLRQPHLEAQPDPGGAVRGEKGGGPP